MEDKIYSACLAAQAVFTVIQPYELFQWISLIITIISAIVGLAFKIVHWYNEANKDGKIEMTEIEEGLEILQDSLEEIKENEENEKTL